MHMGMVSPPPPPHARWHYFHHPVHYLFLAFCGTLARGEVGFVQFPKGVQRAMACPQIFVLGVLGTVSERWVWLLVQSVRFDNFSVGVLRCTSCEVMREVCTVLRSLFLAVRSHKRVFTAMLHISYICDLRNAMICIFFVHRTYAIEGLP